MADSVSWDVALAELRRLRPAAKDYSSPDRLSEAAAAVAGRAEWRRLPEWEDLSDLDILDRVYTGQPPLAGPMILVTEHAFYSRGSPTRVAAERLREFVAGHLASAGECFFNGDVIILATEAGWLTVFHHEGAFAHWDLGRAVRAIDRA